MNDKQFYKDKEETIKNRKKYLNSVDTKELLLEISDSIKGIDNGGVDIEPIANAIMYVGDEINKLQSTISKMLPVRSHEYEDANLVHDISDISKSLENILYVQRESLQMKKSKK